MKTVLPLFLAASLSGCAFTHIRDGKGRSLTRISVGTSSQVGHVKAALGDKTTLDVGPLVVDQAAAAGQALETAARLAPLLIP